MSEQETMRLVAEVVDKSTGVLKKIQESYKQLGEETRKTHETGSKAAREHSKHMKELHERVEKAKDLLSDAMVPVLASLGVTALGVGEAVGKLAEKIKGAAEKYQLLNDTVKRGHVSATFVQGMSEAFTRLGMDASKANEFIGETGETLDKLRRGNAAEMQRLTDTFGNALPWLEKVVAGARNYQEAAERIMKSLTDTRIPIDQRRKLAEAFHIDPRIASKNGEEVGKALAESMNEAAKHALNLDTLSKLDDAYTNLAIAQQHFWSDLINMYGPEAVTAIEKVTEATDAFGKQINYEIRDAKALYGILKKIWDGPNIPFLKKTPGEALHDYFSSPETKRGSVVPFMADPHGLYHKSAFFSDLGGDRSNPLYRGVRDGVLDAFRQLMGEKSAGAGGGFTNASYTTEGGGFNSAVVGRWGGYGSGGTGGHGSRSDSPSGSGGGGGVIPDDAGADTSHLIGSDFLEARRSRFAKELKDPNVMARVKAMMATEGTPLQSLEAAMNRADYTGKSLAQTLSPSFYGPMRKASFARIVAAMRNGSGKKYDALVAKALAGSDTIHGYTDQGMPTDPNGSRRSAASARDHISVRDRTGLNEFTDWAAGPGGRRAAHAYRQMIEQHINAERHGARLSDHIIRNHLKSSHGSGLLGHASLSVDFHNMPRGTRTSAKVSGMFKEAKLNRGRPMAMASQDS
ncbi:hypothetical protein ABIF38_005684 [Bradyrhizobium japonicum]|uniref:hypothetical protein n=1 Tax=Bradyrhizobium elkanii TaxID=29448 RepID=UPI000360EE5D|nr:hypothetical protein [Bradyrhizobium elkanii]MBP2434758.1 hypothetical protein [Bradyrhizobium elkanii]MCP1732006.1 hypothetical protein [Bradyrhizobium elkanii]MCS3567340.1 hypothetical protein [Bradyrhizobium elkanii]MCS3591175.1 hypothetical protein [Bradyrhizobium elkanii]MCS3620618.1 hypothetical protein [Bradyrhizobium elkanii]